jgi:hypothetical protein
LPIRNQKHRGRPRRGENNRIIYSRTSMTIPKEVFDFLEQQRKPPHSNEEIPRSTFYANVFQKYKEEVEKIESA